MATGIKTGGRKAGTPNKVTARSKSAFAALVEGNLPRLQALWEQVAADDPRGALEIMAKFAEYVYPKLARTELAGDGENGAIQVVIQKLAGPE